MNIDGLGPETVDMFYRLGLIRNTVPTYINSQLMISKVWIVWEKNRRRTL